MLCFWGCVTLATGYDYMLALPRASVLYVIAKLECQ